MTKWGSPAAIFSGDVEVGGQWSCGKRSEARVHGGVPGGVGVRGGTGGGGGGGAVEVGCWFLPDGDVILFFDFFPA